MLLPIVLATSAWLLVMAAVLLALCGLISRAKRLRHGLRPRSSPRSRQMQGG